MKAVSTSSRVRAGECTGWEEEDSVNSSHTLSPVYATAGSTDDAAHLIEAM